MPPYYDQGLYFVTGVEQAWTESSNHNDMFVLKVLVNGHAVPIAGADGEITYELQPVGANYTRTIRVTLVANNIEMAMKKLRYAGFTGTSFDDLNLVGRQFLAVSQPPQFKDGKSYEQWDLPLPPLADSGPPLESKPGITRKLNALFGKQLKEGGESAAAPRAAPAAVVPAGGGSDPNDIPFSPVVI